MVQTVRSLFRSTPNVDRYIFASPVPSTKYLIILPPRLRRPAQPKAELLPDMRTIYYQSE
jgi:hypothetical protein